jgi:alkylated DNA repair dioxygenase AlkB
MLFTPPPASASSTLPLHLDSLLGSVSSLLHDHLPGDVHQTVFSQSLARQAILNLYPPGQGITPHIDLPNRYADGILGISLIGGTVMDFTHEKHGRHSVYLPSRSVYVLSGEARWDWKHGIEGRDRDVVDGVTILRDIRVSVTFRWMKQGGDVLS